MIKLNEIQRKHYHSLHWLIADENRAEGKTFLLAVMFLQKAYKNLEKRIDIFDHQNENLDALMRAITHAFSLSDLPDYKLLFIGSKKSLIMVRKSDNELAKEITDAKAIEKKLLEKKDEGLEKPPEGDEYPPEAPQKPEKKKSVKKRVVKKPPVASRVKQNNRKKNTKKKKTSSRKLRS